jgi:hypothetical protein
MSAGEAEEFFDALARHAKGVKLASLSISWPSIHGVAVWHALVTCLPFLVHLKELQTGTVPNEFAALLLDSLRQNGSLHTMTNWKYSYAFNSFDLTRLCAYGHRNESLPNLLGPFLGDKFPSVCAAARHQSHMGVNFAFMGVLHCNNCVGAVTDNGVSKANTNAIWTQIVNWVTRCWNRVFHCFGSQEENK